MRTVTVLWGLVISASAGVLLLAGGLVAVQTASIVAAFPFMVVLVAATVALLRGLATDEAFHRADLPYVDAEPSLRTGDPSDAAVAARPVRW